MLRPHPTPFRDGAIALVRRGHAVSDVARELAIADSYLRNWPRQDQPDRRRDGAHARLSPITGGRAHRHLARRRRTLAKGAHA